MRESFQPQYSPSQVSYPGALNLSRLAPALFSFTAALVFCVGVSSAAAESKPQGRPIDFSAQVRPILSGKCFHCHGPDESSRKAKLRLDLRDEALKDHKGSRAIVPGDIKASELVRRITTSDADDIMPPPKDGHPVTPAEVEILKRWIKEGAAYSEHWAFRKPVKPLVPKVRNERWAKNAIDQFVLARLAEEKLKPSAPADRYSLIRRVSFDITGLPPTPAETEAFVNDKSPQAFEKVVDRLLASPAYGERWARIWMDLARYADSAGYGSDPLRLNMWPWRDWVIQALNKNISYRDFTIQQIAGDLLPGAGTEQQVATGFHRNTMTNTEGGTDDEEWRVAAVKDRADVTGQVWMGLTMGCAKCHTHKFDPITQREYYQFYAFFNQTEDNDQPDERPTLPLPTPEQKSKMDAISKEIEELEAARKLTTDALKKDWLDWETRYKAGYQWEPLPANAVTASRSASAMINAEGLIELNGGIESGDVLTVKIPLKEADKLNALKFEVIPSSTTQPTEEIKLSEFRAYNVPTSAAPVKARFVRVELPGGQRRLSLAEVKVMSSGADIATKGKASQSTTSPGGDASKAIDGKTDGDFAMGSTTLTDTQDNPWWEVDLGKAELLDFVSLWNRTDRGLGTRLTDYRVTALDEQRNKVWERGGSSAPTPEVTFRTLNETQVGLQNATADYQSEGDGADKLIDGNNGSAWSLKGQASTAHEAVMELSGQPSTNAASTLVVTLHASIPQSAGKVQFRISGTKAARPVRILPQSLARITQIESANRSEADRESLLGFIRPFAPSLQPLREQIAAKRDALAGIRPVAVPVMRDRTEKRVSHLLNKGNFLDAGEVVDANVPAAFHPLAPDKPKNRLGLAEWLVSRDNPLTARVAVNRLWSQLFGVGLVETEEDFGTQGALPSHPELLDWLAVEFMDQNWDMKAMIRTMVLSATYQQTTKATPQLLEKDPRNRLLARAQRRRLDAEMVRDQALLLSGLLSSKIGGPSVYPIQPEGLWRAAFNGERTWATSEGEDKHRRGLYTFWRRTVPYPSMVTFDAPSRETCTVRRIATNTPLQSFVTLNDPVYVEAAQALARRIMQEGGATVADRIKFALRLCVGRPAAKAQIKALEALYASELQNYSQNKEAATKLATEPLGPLPAGLAAPEAAAWTTVANVLLNLDAMMVKG